MSRKTPLFTCIVAALALAATAQDFHEGWETAQVRDYVPSDTTFINGEEGFWFVGDSVSQFPECGQTRNEAQILLENGNRVLRLLSNRSFSACADDIWVLLAEFDAFNENFGVPLNPNTIISFTEWGELEDPQLRDGGVNCLVPPCFDNVSLVLTDSSDNILAYVLQRYPAAVENQPNINYGDTYREIFLDPSGGNYQRNLYNDFQLIPTFEPVGAEIVAIEFRVDEHGWGIIDDIMIGDGGADGTVPVYRFWSPVAMAHFYTTSESERQTLINLFPDTWLFEGTAWYAPPANGDPIGEPVYRFWSPFATSHFYTISEAERQFLLDEYAGVWIFEGVAFYAFPPDNPPAGTSPVYRFWSPFSQSHFYTISEVQRQVLLDEFADVWIPEGIAWYAYPP